MNKFTYFSVEELKKIHQSTLHILEHTGIVMDDPEAQELFTHAGATVNAETNIVKIPPCLIEEALATAPSRVYLAGRGDKGFYLGDGEVRFTTFGEAPQIMDPETQEVRDVVLKDVENYAKVVDALEQQDMCWDAWVVSDAPAETYSLHTFAAYLDNTVKPVCCATPNGALAKAAVKIATAVAGSKEALRKKPLMIAGTCPKSPLHLDKGICEAIIILARAGVPSINMSALTTGGTGPVTLAGTIAVHNAEILACLVLSQLAEKGAPFVYGSCTSGLDLRKVTATYGCPEIAIFSAAFAQLCQFYALPLITAGFWTDSKTPDMQCGHEKTLNGLLPALAGADMIFGTACIAAGMIGSLGQLVADDEMIAMIRHTLKGVPVSDEDLALDVIDNVGPKGNFLAEEHTIAHMKSALAWTDLLDRNGYHEWNAEGRKDLSAKANEKAQEIINNHKVPHLSKEIKDQIAAIIAETEKNI